MFQVDCKIFVSNPIIYFKKSIIVKNIEGGGVSKMLTPQNFYRMLYMVLIELSHLNPVHYNNTPAKIIKGKLFL
jgi:hypothetical protein